MATKISSTIKNNGVYYTPIELAHFLAKPLIRPGNLTVFDPAYGEGALLLAAERICAERKNSHSCALKLYGCDKSPRNIHLKHLPKAHLIKSDFFEYSLDHKFEVILMNPPYVRHHTMSDRRRRQYQKIVEENRLASQVELGSFTKITERKE